MALIKRILAVITTELGTIGGKNCSILFYLLFSVSTATEGTRINVKLIPARVLTGMTAGRPTMNGLEMHIISTIDSITMIKGIFPCCS